MASWKNALARTRTRLTSSFSNAFQRRGDVDDEMSLEALEETLLEADVPVRLAAELIDSLQTGRAAGGMSARDQVRSRLVERLSPTPPLPWGADRAFISILVVGVNGSGKTTTAAKLAHHVQADGRRPLLGAADTFRAAGSEQLRLWADRVGCDVVAGETGADPASVAYDAMDAALARSADVLIVDTAGRMHNKAPLMEELRKVQRAMQKRLEGAPNEVWIVLDATIGQNALMQARQFHEAVPLSGVIVAKLDGSAKAGFLFGIARELGVPILFAGLGEQADDLVPFDAPAFVDALLGIEQPEERPVV